VKHFEAFMRAYHATILSVDDSVGRVYQTLSEMGVLDDTLFIFASDNGMYLGEHGMTDKRGMHEGSIRVPLLARYPKLIKAGTKVSEMVLNQDLAPSILDVCGAPGLGKVHGRSWKGLFDGTESNWRKSWYYEYNFEDQFPYTPNVRGVRTDEWKYIRYPEGGDQPDKHMAELYNLAEDPEELNNLVNDPKYADKVVELREELHRLMEESGAFPDEMPLNPQMRTELPDASIR
jgi:N-acetylglucosamine-6-sulfatase